MSKAAAAYNTLVSIAGTSTSFTDEPTVMTAPSIFQIVNPAKRMIDRNFGVVVELGGHVYPKSNYTVDYLNGIIDVNGDSSINVNFGITVSANYLPTALIGGATEYNINLGGDIHDKTSFDQTSANGGYRSKRYGIIEVSVSISRYDDLSGVFKQKLQDREEVLIVITPGGGSETIRGWFVIESANAQGDIGSLETESLSFQLAADSKKTFSWG